MGNSLAQMLAVTALNLRTVPGRWASSLVIVVGIAGVVTVMVALLALAQGFASTLQRTGHPDRAIVLRGGATGELASSLTIDRARIVATLPGIAQIAGSAAASPELYLVADVPKRATGAPANLPLRGMTERGIALRPEVKILQGRLFKPGRAELIAGRAAADQFAGLNVGAKIKLRDATLEVVGIFSAEGGGHESEVWLDLPVVQDLFRGPGVISSLRVAVATPADIPLLKRSIEGDRRLDMTVTAEPAYYARQAARLTGLITGFGYAVATIMAIGALFAALNTMYSAVSARTVEIATLRALGFGGLPVMVSVIVEAMILATIGGVLGGLIAYLGFNGTTVSTLNQTSFSQVAFDFAVTPTLIRRGITIALLLGLIGGLMPAWRATRVPVTQALRRA